jgi:hypothetical protein
MLPRVKAANCVPVAQTRMDHHQTAAIWLQIATTVILLEMALWSSGTRQHLFSLAALLWVVVTSIFPRHTARELGLSAQGFRSSFWFIPASSAIAAFFVCGAWQIGTLHPAFGARTHSYTYLAYAIWAVIQQFILQSYLFVRFESLLASGRKAVVACAALFAFVHIPNPVLTVATFAGGLAFCEIFRRYRNLYSLGIAHALLGISVAVSIPSALHHDMRVGIGFLHPPISKAAVSDLQEPGPNR